MKKPKRVKKDEYDGKLPKVWSQFEDEGYGDKAMEKDSKKWDIFQSLIQIWFLMHSQKKSDLSEISSYSPSTYDCFIMYWKDSVMSKIPISN